jgi:hypothetical protein
MPNLNFVPKEEREEAQKAFYWMLENLGSYDNFTSMVDDYIGLNPDMYQCTNNTNHWIWYIPQVVQKFYNKQNGSNGALFDPYFEEEFLLDPDENDEEFWPGQGCHESSFEEDDEFDQDYRDNC